MNQWKTLPHSSFQFCLSRSQFILKQLVDTAIDMHAKGAFHRNIKLENALVQFWPGELSVQITDFACVWRVPHGGSYSGGATALPRPQKAQRSTCCRPDSYIRRSGRVLIFTVRTSPHVIYWVQERQCCQVCAQHPVDSVCLPADRGPEPTSLLCAVCPAASFPWRVFIPRNLDNKDKMNQRESYRPALIICWAPSCLCRDLPSNCLFLGYLPISTWPQNFEFEFSSSS